MANLNDIIAQQPTTPSTQPSQSTSGAWNTSLEKLLQDFESSQNPLKITMVPRLKDITVTLWSESITWLQEVVNTLSRSSDVEELSRYFEKLERIYEKYVKQNADIVEKSKTEEALFKTEFLDESDMFLFNSIKWKIEKSESMSFDEIIEAAKDIELSWKISGEEAWNELFDDIRDQVPKNKISEFDAEVKRFKKEEKDVYTSNINTSDTNITLDTYLSGLEKWDFDSQLESGLKIKVPFTGILESLGISFGEEDGIEVWPFYSKTEAARTIYKLKLTFAELESSGWTLLQSGILAWYYNGITNMAKSWLGEAAEQFYGIEDGIVGDVWQIATWDVTWVPELMINLIYGSTLWVLTAVLATIWYLLPPGAVIYIMWAPVESWTRRIKDWLARRFGDKWWAQPLKWIGKWVRAWSNFFGTQAIKWGRGVLEWWIISRVLNLWRFATAWGAWTLSKPIDLLLWASGNLLETAERIHLDPTNLLTDRILLVDGLTGNTGDTGLDNATSDAAIEIRSRVKILTLLRRKAEYEWNQEKLRAIDDITKTSLYSNSESFYIDVNNVVQWRRDNSRSINAHKIKSIWELFFILNKKENVVSEYKKNIERMSQMLGVIYKRVQYDPEIGKIDLPDTPEYTDAYKSLKANIDYSLISNAEEIRREKLINELVEEIKMGRWWFMTAKQVEREIAKIIEGKTPQFKIIQEVLKKRGQLSDSQAQNNIEKFREKVLNDRWYGTDQELIDALNNIETAIPDDIDINDPNHKIRSLEDLKIEWEKLKKLSLRGNQSEFQRLTDMNTFKIDLDITELLIDMWSMPGKNIGNIKRELGKLVSQATDKSLSLDWTRPEFHYSLEQIFSGKSYDSRWNGNFGNSNMDIDKMNIEFANFDIQVRDTRMKNFIQALENKNFPEQIEVFSRLSQNTDLLRELWNIQEYRELETRFEGRLDQEVTKVQNTINDLKNQQRAAMSWIIYDERSGDGKIINNNIENINSNIKHLETQYAKATGLRWSIGEKIILVMDSETVTSNIRSEIWSLEVQSQKSRSIDGSNANVEDSTPKTEKSATPKEALESIDFKSEQTKAKNILRAARIEILLAYRGEELKRRLDDLNEANKQVNSTTEFPQLLAEAGTVQKLKDTFIHRFNIPEIRGIGTLRELLSQIGYNSLPETINSFSDLERSIHSTTDISTLNAIKEALSSLKITR